MTPTIRIRRKYDHRLRELVRSTGNIGHALQRGIPRSTARRWLTSTRSEVITVSQIVIGRRFGEAFLGLQWKADDQARANDPSRQRRGLPRTTNERTPKTF